MASLDELQELRLSCKNLTGSQFSHLSKLTKLRCLELFDCKDLAKETLTVCRHWQQFQSLTLYYDGQIPDVLLEPLVEVPELHALHIFCGQESDGVYATIGKLSQLQSLHLSGNNPIQSSWLENWKGLTQLQFLDFSGRFQDPQNSLANQYRRRPPQPSHNSAFDENGVQLLQHISELPSLQFLDLGGIDGLTETALLQLTNMPHLKYLAVELDFNSSQALMHKLRAAIPRLIVHILAPRQN